MGTDVGFMNQVQDAIYWCTPLGAIYPEKEAASVQGSLGIFSNATNSPYSKVRNGTVGNPAGSGGIWGWTKGSPLET
ncbi:MAG: hypothetical protein HY788_10670 [Deltaproteobacteria bacterium]|nr:hypothetical protein [Deltaproteobacteria bacterium]